MKHLLIIFSFLYLLSYQTTANSLIGKSIICKNNKNITTLYVNFKSEDIWSKFYFSDYTIKSFEYSYNADLKEIRLYYGTSTYHINRKDLSYRGRNDFGDCQVYNLRQELIEKMNSEIEQSKSQNKL